MLVIDEERGIYLELNNWKIDIRHDGVLVVTNLDNMTTAYGKKFVLRAKDVDTLKSVVSNLVEQGKPLIVKEVQRLYDEALVWKEAT